MKDHREQPISPLVKQALAHPERFGMLDHITQCKSGVNEADLVHVLGLTPAKVKYHLKVLRNAALIADYSDVRGRHVADTGP